MNKRLALLIAAIVFIFGGSFLGRSLLLSQQSNGQRAKDGSASALDTAPVIEETEAAYNRIVSLAPSITETLFALGLGERVVGVTRYCDYPESAKQKAQVGGYFDPNNEAIVALNPDLVILFQEHESTRKALKGAGIEFLVVSHHSITDILNSIETTGQKMGQKSAAAKQASTLTASLRKRMEAVRKVAATTSPKTVMISTGRNMGNEQIEDVYITGKDGFYDEMLQILGAENAYSGNVAFPVVSNEGMIRMNPDIIIDMVPDLAERNLSKQEILAQWHQLQDLKAVKENHVYVLTDDYVVVPGPRFVLLLEQLHAILSEATVGESNE